MICSLSAVQLIIRRRQDVRYDDDEDLNQRPQERYPTAAYQSTLEQRDVNVRAHAETSNVVHRSQRKAHNRPADKRNKRSQGREDQRQQQRWPERWRLGRMLGRDRWCKM